MFVYEIRTETPEKMLVVIEEIAAQGARNIEQQFDGVTAKVTSPVELNFAAISGLVSSRELKAEEKWEG